MWGSFSVGAFSLGWISVNKQSMNGTSGHILDVDLTFHTWPVLWKNTQIDVRTTFTIIILSFCTLLFSLNQPFSLACNYIKDH